MHVEVCRNWSVSCKNAKITIGVKEKTKYLGSKSKKGEMTTKTENKKWKNLQKVLEKIVKIIYDHLKLKETF